MRPLDEPPQANSPIRPRRLLAFFLKYWWIPTVTLAISVGTAVAYSHWVPSTYVSTASMWETEKLRLPESGIFTGDAQNYLGTQIELLRGPELGEPAMKRMQSSYTNSIPTDKNGVMVRPHISVIQVPKSTILTVEATSTDPLFARAYLNALLEEYLGFKKNLKKSVSDYTVASIEEQVLRLERELKNEQSALTAFERTNNLAILQEEGNISGAYLAKLDTQLSDSRLELKLLEANEAEQKKNGTTGASGKGLIAMNSGLSNERSNTSEEEPQSAARQVELLKIEREKLSKYLRPKHPKIIKLDADIERSEKLIELLRTQNQAQLEVSRQVLQSRIEGLQTAVHEWQDKVMKANSGIAEAEHLKLNVNRIQVEYDRLLGLLQNIDISRNIDQESLAVLQPASQGVRTRKTEQQQLAFACIIGLLVGGSIVLLVALLDDRFTSVSELGEKFADVIVGQVPELPRLKGQSSLPLLQIEDDRQMYAESYRNLRSALFFMPALTERPKVMLITSAMPHEGKSTIASNLARTLALGGSRVVLIDADLRRGYLHELLGMKREPGLADLLQRPDELDKIVQSNCMPNLWFIARGSALSRPGDLFMGPSFDLLVTRLREQFDYVIMDTSPVFAADDVTTLAPRVDGTLFIIRNRISRSGPVGEALDLLGRRQAKILGVVINGADAASKSYYYYKNREYYK